VVRAPAEPAFGKKLVVHVGAPKTGTTAIQDFLFTHRDALLERHGVMYPHDPQAVGVGIDRLANGAILQPEYYDDVKLRQLFDQWFSVADTVVLSEEVLFLASNSRMLKWLQNERVQIEVFCVLRNAADYLTSLWMELNRFENKANPPPLMDFVGGRSYLVSITNLLRLVAERPEFFFVARPYRSRSSSHTSVSEFLEAIGVTWDGAVRQDLTKNLSMSRKEADIRQLTLINGWQHSGEIDSADITSISRELESGDDRPVIETLPDQLIETICDEHNGLLNHFMESVGYPFDFSQTMPRCFGVEREVYQPIHSTEYGKIKSLLAEFSSPRKMEPGIKLEAGRSICFVDV
jgi:hypothetical protein